MRILFFGTPPFALTCLERIHTPEIEIVGIVSQPDKPAGRGRAIHTSPVAEYARAENIPLYQPVRLKDEALWDEWRALVPDLSVVVAYGRILPQAVIDIPHLGTINVHASLLPQYRGAAPIERAIMAGDSKTGVTIMEIVEALDAGPMISKRETPIFEDDTASTLEARLAGLGADLLAETLALYENGRPNAVLQDESQVTYAPPLKREEGFLDWTLKAKSLHDRIRALTPWPGSWALLKGKKVKIVKARCSPLETQSASPGEIIHVSPAAIEVACGAGVLSVLELQLEGKRALTPRDFLNGYPLSIGERFEKITGL